MARLRDLYELGDIDRAEYLSRRADLERQRAELERAAEPTFVRQHTALRSLVDDWDEMNADQRNALLRSIFENVIVGVDGNLELTPVEGWRPFLKSCLPHPRRVPNERKTGLEPAKSTRSVTMCATGRIQIRAA